jgi:hypothetical protein
MDDAEREQLITEHEWLVRTIGAALRDRAQVYRIDEEDLLQSGQIGLIRAVDAWQPHLFSHTNFLNFAWVWIRGQMCRLFRHDPMADDVDLERYAVQMWDPAVELEGLKVDGNHIPLLIPIFRDSCREHPNPMPRHSRDCCMRCHKSGYDPELDAMLDPRKDPQPVQICTRDVPKPKVSPEVRETRRQRRARIFGHSHPGIAHAS